MKKIIALVVALMMCCAMVPAMAENVPSKTTIDMTQIEIMTAADVTPAGDFLIAVEPVSMTLDTVVEQMIEFTAVSAPVNFFGTEAKAALVAMMPDADVEKLAVNEIAPLWTNMYKASYGDIEMIITTASVYTDDQKIAAIVGLVNGPKAEDIEWNVLEAEVKNGKVIVTFTVEVLEKMNNRESIMAIIG